MAKRAFDNNPADLVSVPGYLSGKVRLLSGAEVSAVVPSNRGLYSWNTNALVERSVATLESSEDATEVRAAHAEALENALSRIYFEFRNLGITAEHRALNFAATNAFQLSQVIDSATRRKLELSDRPAVTRSPICREGSECFDVELSFFDPENVRKADRIYKFTIDVSDVVPVSIGQVRAYSRRA